MSATICYQIVSTTVNCACITIEPINNIKQLFQEIGGVVKDIIIIYDTSNFGQLQNSCHTNKHVQFSIRSYIIGMWVLSINNTHLV